MAIYQFISQLPTKEKLIFMSGKFFLGIASRILKYRDFHHWQLHYNRLEATNTEVAFDGKELHYRYEGMSVLARKSSSDTQVFETVILREEYRTALNLFRMNHIPLNNFIDLGSNIGLTSLYVKKHFPNARVVALEPDKGNYDMMVRNFSLNHLTDTDAVMAGIGSCDGYLQDNGTIRDHRDWSKSFAEVSFPTKIPSFSIMSVMKKFNMDTVDFLKIDIEGAEQNIFRSGADLCFLEHTKIIAIEIHDEFEMRRQIHRILKENDFIIFDDKETTIAIKREIFHHNRAAIAS